MYSIKDAGKIGWFSRIEIFYKQPRDDKKLSEVAFFRSYDHTHLYIFRERLDRGENLPSHNRSGEIPIPYTSILEVIILRKAKFPSGDIIGRRSKSPKK